MKFEDLVDHPQFKSMSAKGKSKYGFIDDIVDNMVDNAKGKSKYGFIDDMVDDMFGNATNENINYEFYDEIDDGIDDEAGSREIDFDIDFFKVYYASFGDKNKIISTMSNQQLKEYQLLGGSDLTNNRFQDPNVIPKEEIVFDDDLKKMFFAEKDDRENILKNMTEKTYDEYSLMKREYIKTDYFDLSEVGKHFAGDKLIENRFKVQLEPIQELDGSYSDEFLRLYYAPSDERFNIESNLNVHGIGKGSLEDHKKMVSAYQKEPEEYRDKLKNISKKKI